MLLFRMFLLIHTFSGIHTKRKREQFTSLTLFEVLPNTQCTLTSKAHAIRREPSTLLLCIVFEYWEISNNKIQSGRFNVYVFSVYLSP